MKRKDLFQNTGIFLIFLRNPIAKQSITKLRIAWITVLFFSWYSIKRDVFSLGGIHKLRRQEGVG